jgi:hypothetical protein
VHAPEEPCGTKSKLDLAYQILLQRRMSFERIRTIKGRRYRYLETRWREAGRVRSRSEYLGRVDVIRERALAVAEREAAKVDDYQRKEFGETGLERKEREEREHVEKVYASLTIPTTQTASTKDGSVEPLNGTATPS